MWVRLTLNYSTQPRLLNHMRRKTFKHKTYECIWMELQRNEKKWKVMGWVEMREITLYVFVCFCDVIPFSEIIFRSLPSPIHFNSFPPFLSVTFHLLSFPRSTQYLSSPSLQLCSFPFISSHFLSNTFVLFIFNLFFLSYDWTV